MFTDEEYIKVSKEKLKALSIITGMRFDFGWRIRRCYDNRFKELCPAHKICNASKDYTCGEMLALWLMENET